MKTTITVDSETRKRLNKAKLTLDTKNVDETINKVFDIAEKVMEAQ